MATGTPMPVPIAILLWDGWAGLDDDSSGVGVGKRVGSERLGDVEKATELKDVAGWEEEEASVEAFGSAVFPASDLGNGGASDEKGAGGKGEAGDEEGAGGIMTRPTSPLSKLKSRPLQHPPPSRPSPVAPQHQLTA